MKCLFHRLPPSTRKWIIKNNKYQEEIGYEGVKQTEKGRFQAYLEVSDTFSHYLGIFDTAEEAGWAYNQARAELECWDKPENPLHLNRGRIKLMFNPV